MSSGQGKFPLEVVTDNNLLRPKYEQQELEGSEFLTVTTNSAQGIGNIAAGGELLPTVSSVEQWGFLGDSITQGAYAGDDWLNEGWLTWFRRLTQCRISVKPENIFAVFGTGVLHFRDVQVPQAIAAKLSKVTVMIGTNSVSIDDLIPPVEAGIDALKAAGIVALVSPILPRGGAQAFTGAQKKLVDAYNRWLWRRSLSDASTVYVDTLQATVNFTNAGLPKSGILRDGIHPDTQGAYVIGRAFAAAADKLAPASRLVPSAYAGQYDPTTNVFGNIVPGDFAGAAGAKINGVDAASVVPTSWTAGRHSAGSSIGALWEKSVVDDTYQGVRVSLSGTGTGFYTNMQTTSTALPAGLAAGDRVRFTIKCRMSADCAGVLGPYARLFFGGTVNQDIYDGSHNDSRNLSVVTGDDLMLSCDAVVPASPVSFQVYFGVQTKSAATLAGSVTYWIAECRKLAPDEI